MRTATTAPPLSPPELDLLARLWTERPGRDFRTVRRLFGEATGRRLSNHTLYRHRPEGAGRRNVGMHALRRVGVSGPCAELVRARRCLDAGIPVYLIDADDAEPRRIREV